MNFVILDLEWNGAYSKKKRGFVNEIIEFGAVKLDSNLNIADSFSMLITPQIGKKLNNRISQLTHITNEELENADNTFTHVLSKFQRFVKDSVVLTWGNSDIHTLMENCVYYNKSNIIPFLSKYCDLQIYCQNVLGINDKSKQMGLSTCAEILNINSHDLTLHRALADAELSALCFKKLYNQDEFMKSVSQCDDEFYRKMTFRVTNITDINNPLIDRSQMTFDCPECAVDLKRKSSWTVRNRQFKAVFKCPCCNNEFTGRVAFKLRYEGVKVIKKLVPIVKEENENKETS
jgi:DNA polymerase III alpha subunit (gram-positive type)